MLRFAQVKMCPLCPDGKFAPGVNLARVPTGGRNFEFIGEDPHLAARLVFAEVEGIQSEGVVACVKHWVDNNQEGPGHNGRLEVSSAVPARAQHELYHAPFAGAIAAGAGAVMCPSNILQTEHFRVHCRSAQAQGLTL